MNNKQIKVTGILIALMLIMVFGERFMAGKKKDVALINNSIGSMLKYSALDGNIIYELPDNWICTEVSYPGEYIAYNNKFYGEEMGINGYIQVIKTKSALDDIIESDMNILNEEKVKNMKNFDDRIGDKVVKKLIYDEKTSIGRVYESKVYYTQLDEPNTVLKLSFSAGRDKHRGNYETIYRIILDSFKRKV